MFDDLKSKKTGYTSYSTTTSVGEFLGHLFSFRDELHLLHLSTTSFAQHKALNEAYDGILDLADELIESVQGIYGLQKISVMPCKKGMSSEETVKYMYDFIDQNRKLFKESWIQNILDEIQQLFAQTLYKLKFLK